MPTVNNFPVNSSMNIFSNISQNNPSFLQNIINVINLSPTLSAQITLADRQGMVIEIDSNIPDNSARFQTSGSGGIMTFSSSYFSPAAGTIDGFNLANGEPLTVTPVLNFVGVLAHEFGHKFDRNLNNGVGNDGLDALISEGKSIRNNMVVAREIYENSLGQQMIDVRGSYPAPTSNGVTNIFVQDIPLEGEVGTRTAMQLYALTSSTDPASISSQIATLAVMAAVSRTSLNPNALQTYLGYYGLLPEGGLVFSRVEIRIAENSRAQLILTELNGRVTTIESSDRAALMSFAQISDAINSYSTPNPVLPSSSHISPPAPSTSVAFSDVGSDKISLAFGVLTNHLPGNGQLIQIDSAPDGTPNRISYSLPQNITVKLELKAPDENHAYNWVSEEFTIGNSSSPTILRVNHTLNSENSVIDRHVVDLRYGNNTIQLEQIGQTLGSVLGKAFGGNSFAGQIIGATIGSTILQNIGEFIQITSNINIINQSLGGGLSTPLTDAASITFSDMVRAGPGQSVLTGDFFKNFQFQFTNGLASLLAAELADVLDLDGDWRSVFEVGTTTLTNHFLSKALEDLLQNGGQGLVLNSTANFLEGFSLEALGPNLAASFGGLFGNRLAQLVVTAESSDAALFSSATSAVGSYLGSQIIGQTLLSIIPGIGPLVGAFLGSLIGTLIGNALFPFDDDRVEHFKVFTQADGTLGVGALNVRDTNGALAQSMAQTVATTVNDLAKAIGGKFEFNDSFLVYVGWGANTNNDLEMTATLSKNSATTSLYGQVYHTNDNQQTVQEHAKSAVAAAIDEMLSELVIVGGNIYKQRAFDASHDEGLTALSTDIEIAANYQTYVDNTALINTLIVNSPDSAFSMGWLLTLQRASELNLNKAGRTDFSNGLPGFMDNLGLQDFSPGDDQDPTLGDVSITPDGDNGIFLDIALRATAVVPKRIFDLYGGQAAEVVLQDGSRVLRFHFDRETFLRGQFDVTPVAEFRANGSGASPGATDPNGDTFHVRGDDADQNLWIGQDTGVTNEYRDEVNFWETDTNPLGKSNLLIGAGGRDVIFGGTGRDWIEGGAGDDAIYGGNGDDIIVGGPGNDYLTGDRDTGSVQTVLVNGVPQEVWVEQFGQGPRGADLFILKDNFGYDTITDFDIDRDRILFGTPDLRSFAEIMEHARQDGADVIIEPNPTSSVRLKNVLLSSLTASNFESRPAPVVSVANIVVQEGTATNGSDGFLSTSGNQIVDKNGTPFHIVAVNWFGLESEDLVPHGLYDRDWRSMMDQMKSLGFNTIRLPFASETLDPGARPLGGVNGGVNLHLNDDWLVSGQYDWTKPIEEQQAITSLEIMDRIIDYAGKIGLRIILDHHRSDLGVSASENGLWYNTEYPESRWLSDWEMLAKRYAGNPTVIGADLHNEPHGKPEALHNAMSPGETWLTPQPATWGDGNPATDWRLAAEKAGNAIGEVNPDWLIFVEGIETYNGETYWWGGNLQGAEEYPVRLDVANKLVYSPHDYPNSVFSQEWFSDSSFPQNLISKFRDNWGYIYETGMGPVFIGEIGTKMEDPKDLAWLEKMVAYLKGDMDLGGIADIPAGTFGPSFAWWAWNAASGDTGGILKDDWRQVETAKILAIKDLLVSSHALVPGGTVATFTVSLSTPATEVITMDYRTVPNGIQTPGAAVSGGDFASVAGTLVFQPGEQYKTISINIYRDSLQEGDETFSLVLSNAKNAVLNGPDQTLTATATIQDDDTAAQPNAPHVMEGTSTGEQINGLNSARNSIYGKDGNDTLIGGDQADLLSGDAGNDTINGGAGNDFATGEDGNDVIYGGLGDDVLIGGAGDDILHGDLNNDVLIGGAGNDTLYGEDHDDVLDGGTGNDALYGGAGNDRLIAGASNDTLDGGDGIDTADYHDAEGPVSVNLSIVGPQNTGAAGHDTLTSIEDLKGSSFGDELIGNAGNNRLSGMDGDDWLFGREGADVLNGGGGFDWAHYAWSYDAITIDLSQKLTDPTTGEKYVVGSGGEAEGDILISIEGIVGSAGDDILTGDEGTNSLYGDAGNDFILGGAGDDWLYGGSGNDELRGGGGGGYMEGGAGDDVLRGEDGPVIMVGGIGDDQFVVNHTGATITENANEGSDTAWIGVNGYTLSQNIEVGRLAAPGAVLLYGSATSEDLVANAEAASTLYGNGGNDVLWGSSYADTMYGGDGDDIMRGQGGADLMFGGSGNDQYVVFSSGAVVTEYANEGYDIVYFTGTGSFTLGQNIEEGRLSEQGTGLVGGNGAELLVGNNAGLASTIYGKGGNDIIYGTAAGDTLSGGAGDDTIYAYGGADTIVFDELSWGSDLVSGFSTADGGKVRFTANSGVTNFSQIGIVHGDGNTQLSHANGTTYFFGVTLTSSDFIFA